LGWAGNAVIKTLGAGSAIVFPIFMNPGIEAQLFAFAQVHPGQSLADRKPKVVDGDFQVP